MGTQRKRPSELPNYGPDWSDVAAYLREIEKTHQATVEISLFTDGRNYVQTLYVRVRASWPQFTGVAKAGKVELYAKWPDHRHSTMEGLSLALLYQIDHKIGSETYTQRELFPLGSAEA